MPLSNELIKLESLVKQFYILDKKYWDLYNQRLNLFKYTSMLIKDHPERKERANWDKKNNYKQIQKQYYETKDQIIALRRKIFLTSKQSYIKLGKGQKAVISFLRDNKDKWLSINQIAQGIGSSVSSVRNSVKTPLNRNFILSRKSGRINEYKISEKGLSFHVDNRPLYAYDSSFLNYIAENQPISLSKAKSSIWYKKDSLRVLQYQKFIRIRNERIFLTRKGKIYFRASKIYYI